jgi:hypothetical protein
MTEEDGLLLLEELFDELGATGDADGIALDDGAEEYGVGVLATGELSDT